MITDTETHTLRNGSTITIKYTYPEYNDPLVLEAVVDAMKHIGLFEGIFDPERWALREKQKKQTVD